MLKVAGVLEEALKALKAALKVATKASVSVLMAASPLGRLAGALGRLAVECAGRGKAQKALKALKVLKALEPYAGRRMLQRKKKMLTALSVLERKKRKRRALSGVPHRDFCPRYPSQKSAMS